MNAAILFRLTVDFSHAGWQTGYIVVGVKCGVERGKQRQGLHCNNNHILVKTSNHVNIDCDVFYILYGECAMKIFRDTCSS
jgi:hypothetical protein